MIRSLNSYSSRLAALAMLAVLALAIFAMPLSNAYADEPGDTPVVTPGPTPADIPTPEPAINLALPQGSLAVSFKGPIDAVSTNYLVVSGVKIWHDGNLPAQIKTAPVGTNVVGLATFSNGELHIQLIGLYVPKFDGIIESITVPNSRGEYFLFVNGSPLLMRSGVQVTGGHLVEGIRVVGTTDGVMNNVQAITVVTPFPLDILSGNASYPWPIYALFALWLPVLGLVMIMIMGRNKKSVAQEEAEIRKVEEAAAVTLDPAEEAEENELQVLEETERKEQAAFDEQLNQYAQQGITLPFASDVESSAEPESLIVQASSEDTPIPGDITLANQPLEMAVVGEASATLLDPEAAESAGRLRRISARAEFLARHNS